MNARKYEQLEDMLCKELEQFIDKGTLRSSDIETIDKLTHALKNTYKIHMGENGGYSQAMGYPMDGDWSADIRGSYGRGNSYGRYSYDDNGSDYSGARRGTHYVRGHYSRDDAKSMMIEQLERTMDMATTDKEKETIRRAIKNLEES